VPDRGTTNSPRKNVLVRFYISVKHKKAHCCSLLIIALAFLAPREACAEYDPAFDMDSCVGGAKLIVSGYLNPSDRITVTETFAGEPGGRTIELGEWGRRFRSLTQSNRWWEEPPAWKRAWGWIMGPPRVEVVAFFPRKIGNTWTLAGETSNLVLLSGDAVYPYDGSGYNSPQPLYGRTQFLAALREAIQAKAERTRLLANPRTIERTKELITLTQRHDHLPGSPDGFWITPFYHLAEIAKGLEEPSAEEEELLLRALADTPTEAEKVKILRLITLIPLEGRAAFDEIIPYLERGQSAEIRRSAMRALGAVDGFRAVDAFGPLLTRRAHGRGQSLLSTLFARIRRGAQTQRASGKLSSEAFLRCCRMPNARV
jgi:hypothetical protein